MGISEDTLTDEHIASVASYAVGLLYLACLDATNVDKWPFGSEVRRAARRMICAHLNARK